ncbi:PAS domain-containing protein [Actinacidiphila acididurans]|uniref:PAS domain-containing protein n=1 Tax=Actinacidiphila acididurans TaxID=2784346 RepID=A0ABS2U926_9ACTN|nr:PAS domain-containing protein [Actinacidiphila acididurans]MBM9510668.1 PAS domain-containing protein [Actinacidiphila acididurans]
MSSRPSRGAARLASILDALPDALLLVDVNGTVVNANAIALETFQSPGTALVGRGLLDLLPAFDPKRIPGSMRSAREDSEEPRTKPTRMVARRTDGTEFPVELTSANLEGNRSPYADYGDGLPHYTGDELLMLVVRDLQHTVDTEVELARQQRQTEMILRAAAEGVVGVDTAGKVVLVNPSAAQILGFRATDLGGKELHPLVHHSRPDGSPLTYEETPLADTLRSGRKHRVRGQVLWRKDGTAVPVDLTTAPVRDGEQLVGAVMTFTDRTPMDALAARNLQLSALLDSSLRGPLAELHAELTGLAADPAGQLWPEANQILHHLSAGYARITTLIDNVLAFQRLDRGEDKLQRADVGLDDVVSAAVEGAVELIGPGRAQFAVHAPEIQVDVDGPRMAQALAHLIADVAGVDSAGTAMAFSGDSTIVVAAAQRGDAVRIDVRGPHAGGNPVHLPLARGVVEKHGGVLQTHEVPGQGSAYVLEFPVGSVTGAAASPRRTRAKSAAGTADEQSADGAPADAGTDPEAAADGKAGPVPPQGAAGQQQGADAAWAIPAAADQSDAAAPTGRRRALRRPGDAESAAAAGDGASQARPSGRRGRRARPETAEAESERPELPAPPIPNALPPAGGSGEGTGRRGRREVEPAGPVPPGGVPVPVPPQPAAPQQGPVAVRRQGPPPLPLPEGWPAATQDQAPADASGRRAIAHPEHAEQSGQPGPSGKAGPSEQAGPGGQAGRPGQGWPAAAGQAQIPQLPQAPQIPQVPQIPSQGRPQGPGQARGPVPPVQGPGPHAPREQGPHQGPGQQTPGRGQGQAPTQGPVAQQPDQSRDPGQGRGQGPAQGQGPDGTRGPVPPQPEGGWPVPPAPAPGIPAPTPPAPAAPSPAPTQDQNLPALPGQPSWPVAGGSAQQSVSRIPTTPSTPPGRGPAQQEAAGGGHGRAISVRTLGQSVQPYGTEQPPQTPTQTVQAQHPQGLPAQVAAGGSGRRRRLTPPPQAEPQSQVPAQPQAPEQPHGPGGQAQARQHPQADPDGRIALPGGRPAAPDQAAPATHTAPVVPGPQPPQPAVPGAVPVPPRPPAADPNHAPGRSYAIGAPAEGADEGPEPLDGPNGAVDVTDLPDSAADPADQDDLRDEPLDEPRRLLVWPEPDVSTRQALTDRGYRPVIVRSREEVDAQVAEPPAALFVDPLTGPITRTALQSLRQAAAAAQVPVLVTAGLGQATREAAYGADPAVLLKALAPRDSEQHPPRVLLVEGHEPIAQAFAATLERRGMQVTHAASETDAMSRAATVHPNLVVMDLMLIRRRRQGIVDWLRGNSRLTNTPLVVYTSADIDPAELPRLASGETVLFLAERSTSTDVQSRIVDLLGKIGA